MTTRKDENNKGKMKHTQGPDPRLISRYNVLLKACQEAFAEGLYDTSYHALAAAMHCAIDLADVERLETVEALATEQMHKIDQVAQDYHHSTASSARRGNATPLSSLVR